MVSGLLPVIREVDEVIRGEIVVAELCIDGVNVM